MGDPTKNGFELPPEQQAIRSRCFHPTGKFVEFPTLGAAKVISRVIRSFQLELPIKALFDSPTVADMASVIAMDQAKKANPEEFECMLAEIESMSDDEARRRLAE